MNVVRPRTSVAIATRPAPSHLSAFVCGLRTCDSLLEKRRELKDVLSLSLLVAYQQLQLYQQQQLLLVNPLDLCHPSNRLCGVSLSADCGYNPG